MSSERIMWENIEDFGCEYLNISRDESGLVAKGTTIFLSKSEPCKVTYEMVMDPFWITKSLKVKTESNEKAIEINSDGQGKWFDNKGYELDHLKGAIDVDISATPFSNSLPINRHTWNKSQKRDFEMAFVSVPDMEIIKVNQSYTFLGDQNHSRTFFYQSGLFETNIVVDENGYVLDYPGIFSRKY
ncbi:hypothetical protein ELQ35_05220 [Peribacillus cavernae]|uniref:Glycolipid-binding domain-containing protein n=1 Tax=Peribacillus cavernae TaxID=1674310 RepID=A0A433HRV7_9BACI|nr:putative glycolipid-binding domain-containing protein [Peribacillus cavernae]MDQ0218781.1 hypothetical protein [Peribacillus cavernae]RUQ30992.1 hypothetical protein ELQ35_05220 [Peribacillus cavernae]